MIRIKNKLKIVQRVNDCFEHELGWRTQIYEDLSMYIESVGEDNKNLLTGRFKFTFSDLDEMCMIRARNLEVALSYDVKFNISEFLSKDSASIITELLNIIHEIDNRKMEVIESTEPITIETSRALKDRRLSLINLFCRRNISHTHTIISSTDMIFNYGHKHMLLLSEMESEFRITFIQNHILHQSVQTIYIGKDPEDLIKLVDIVEQMISMNGLKAVGYFG